jgi:glycosyltransferase involved in cell wall biosynthesis
MRILYATPAYKPAYKMGGPVASVSAAAEMLARRGHHVTVVTTNANLDEDLDVPTDQPVDVDGVEVWYFRREEPLRKWLPFVPYLSESMGFTYSPKMKAALERMVPQMDVVDTQMPFVYPTFAASRAALRHGKALFYHQRGNFIDVRLARRRLKKSIYLALFEKPVMRRATALIALTEAEREAFAALSPGTPCEVIPNGVSLPSPIDGAAARVEARWAIPRDAQVILFLGRLHTWKGAGETLEAFERIERELPRAWLVMAGPDEAGIAARWRAERSNETHRVVFPGVIGGTEKGDLLERADLFCLPSIAEGLSMATLEAMAHRTAVLISPGCNLPEAEAAGAAVIVEKNVDAIAAATSGLLADPDRLRMMGEAGRRFVAANYSWDVVTDRLLDLYARGSSARSSRPRS